MEITVSKRNVPGDGLRFRTITEALKAMPEGSAEPVLILIEPGIYREKLEVRRGNVTLRGTGAPEDVIIEYGDYANMRMEDGSKRGTFRSYVLFLDGDGNALENLTVRNTAFPRREVGQAIALYADGDGICVRNCHLESWQDTLFTGPLPPKELTPGGFVGPKQFDARRMGRQCYENCVISGDVDFIFGSAEVLFYQCELRSVNALAPADQAPESGILGYVTAASTPEGWPCGYVFLECRFTSENCPKGSVYLGRPWRNYAKTVLIRCELGEHIHPAGFHDWNKPESHETCLYGEYGCYGPGADRTCRAPFVHALKEEEAKWFETRSTEISRASNPSRT